MSNKKIVYYNSDEYVKINVGSGAMVFPIDHPGNDGMVSNTSLVFTSKVLDYDEASGRFETENTIYVPA